MTSFTVHTLDTAPDAAKPLLEDSRKAYGMIPNLHALMAESPETLDAYKQLSTLFAATSLGAVEQNVVWLTLNVFHECHYCVPAHTAIAKGAKVPDEIIDALRENRELPDARLNALRTFTLQMADKRGEVSDADIQTFLDAGFSKRHVLDVVTGVAHKVMSNYINAFADTPVDDAFKPFAWTPVANAAE